jgi:hypothetical protein
MPRGNELEKLEAPDQLDQQLMAKEEFWPRKYRDGIAVGKFAKASDRGGV